MGVVDERNVRNYITGILRRNVGDCQLNLRQAKLTADPKEVPGSRVMSDEFQAYTKLSEQGFKQEAVNHTKDEYVRGDVHTNSIESVWAVMKRGMHGVYHHCEQKHLGRYLNEFTFRLNDGNVARHTWERLDSFVKAVAGKRITYKTLTAVTEAQ